MRCCIRIDGMSLPPPGGSNNHALAFANVVHTRIGLLSSVRVVSLWRDDDAPPPFCVPLDCANGGFSWLGCRNCANGNTTVGCGNGGILGFVYAFERQLNEALPCWLPDPLPDEFTGLAARTPSTDRPADRWNRDNRFTTCGEPCVRTPAAPPYGVTGNTCVVPRIVDTANQRESSENVMFCTLAEVSPRCSTYRWCTADSAGPPGCG